MSPCSELSLAVVYPVAPGAYETALEHRHARAPAAQQVSRGEADHAGAQDRDVHLEVMLERRPLDSLEPFVPKRPVPWSPGRRFPLARASPLPHTHRPVWGTRGGGQEAGVGAPARQAAVIAIASLLLAGGCGTADREADVTEVSDRFHAALEAGDGAAACARLSSETAATLERSEGAPCEQAILELDLPAGARAAAAEVYVTSAYADLAEAGAAFLDEGPGGWRISAAGCVPSDGDQPHDCELEG